MIQNAGAMPLLGARAHDYPGKTPVHITFRNSLGNRASIELGERYRITPSAKLDERLSLYS